MLGTEPGRAQTHNRSPGFVTDIFPQPPKPRGSAEAVQEGSLSALPGRGLTASPRAGQRLEFVGQPRKYFKRDFYPGESTSHVRVSALPEWIGKELASPSTEGTDVQALHRTICTEPCQILPWRLFHVLCTQSGRRVVEESLV